MQAEGSSKKGNIMTAKTITTVTCAAMFGAGFILLTDNLLTPANAGPNVLSAMSVPSMVQPVSTIDESDLLWGFQVDGTRIRTCVSSTNSRTLSAPRCGEWTE